MTAKPERLHIQLSGATRRELGLARGEALRSTLAASYAKYAELFRVLGVTEALEREGVERTVAALKGWRTEVIAEFEGIAEAAGVDFAQVVALNARTEILALAPRASSECSTATAQIDGRRFGVQTWDWHIELDPFWHTQEIAGPGHRYAGLTEQGILSKIGVNSAGLALHFNILGHRDDRPDGVPMHVLSSIVLAECGSVTEAIELIREAPVTSSSAFTMLDAARAVSVEMSPAGVFVIEEREGSVQRTNNFQSDVPLAAQKSEIYEPDSSARLALVRERLAAASVADTTAMVQLLVTGEGQPPLTCVPDMALQYGDRWASLATVVTDPEGRTIRVLDGMPTEAATGAWRTITV
jgi:isopenicillin-N N-acyltransferase-like protein